MDPSDEFVLIDNINGTVYTMEQNAVKGPKSVEIELYRIQYGEHIFQNVPYFFDCKTEGFPPSNNPKYLDSSYTMDLDFWDCFGRGNTSYSRVSLRRF